MNFEGYDYLLDSSRWAMDDLHIRMLHGLVMEYRPQTVMEIGSYRGRSAIAYLEAMKAGAGFHLHLVEPEPRDTLFRLIDESGFGNRITLHAAPSWELMIPCDLVFIDGNHTWPAVGDAMTALTLGTRVIALHDTRGMENGYKHVWGSALAARMLERCAGRTWHEDALRREGMATERGFGWSVAG